MLGNAATAGEDSRIALSIEMHFDADADDPSDEHERAEPALQLEPALLPKPQRDGDEYDREKAHPDQHAGYPEQTPRHQDVMPLSIESVETCESARTQFTRLVTSTICVRFYPNAA